MPLLPPRSLSLALQPPPYCTAPCTLASVPCRRKKMTSLTQYYQGLSLIDWLLCCHHLYPCSAFGRYIVFRPQRYHVRTVLRICVLIRSWPHKNCLVSPNQFAICNVIGGKRDRRPRICSYGSTTSTPVRCDHSSINPGNARHEFQT